MSESTRTAEDYFDSLYRMEQIPQEIYDRIATHLGDIGEVPGQSVPPVERAFNRPVLVTIPRKWQRAIESRLFRTLELRSTELDEFEIIMTGVRRRYLRVIRYYIVLPAYPAGERQIFERQGDREANNEAFSAAIHGLLRILKSWEDKSSDGPAYYIQLHIQDISSPTDYRFPSPSYVLTEEERASQFGGFGMRYRYSYIRLLNPAELPIVSGIEVFELHWQNRHGRKLAPQTFIEIAAKLSNLTSMWAQLADTESRYPALRRRCRNGLVRAIESLSFPASIRHLTLNLQHWTPLNQAWQLINLLPPGADHDSLSGAVWKATCHHSSLTTLCINGAVDASLLWPAQATVGRIVAPGPRSPVLVEPFWQSLTSLSIHFDMTSPSGQWYFRAPDSGTGIVLDSSVTNKAESETGTPPGYISKGQEDNNASLRYRHVDELIFSGRDPARIFRLVPDEPALVPLIESFGRACLQIQNLKNVTLDTVLYEPVEVDGKRGNYSSKWGIYFAALAHQSGWRPRLDEQDYPEEDLTVPRLTLNTRNWRPDEDLRKLLRNIGGYGESLDKKYLDLWEIVDKSEAVERLRKSR